MNKAGETEDETDKSGETRVDDSDSAPAASLAPMQGSEAFSFEHAHKQIGSRAAVKFEPSLP